MQQQKVATHQNETSAKKASNVPWDVFVMHRYNPPLSSAQHQSISMFSKKKAVEKKLCVQKSCNEIRESIKCVLQQQEQQKKYPIPGAAQWGHLALIKDWLTNIFSYDAHDQIANWSNHFCSQPGCSAAIS